MVTKMSRLLSVVASLIQADGSQNKDLLKDKTLFWSAFELRSCGVVELNLVG